MVTRARVSIVLALVLVLASTHARTQPQSAITTPAQQFGAAIGDDYFLATFSQLDAYWKTLDEQSDRVSVVDIGTTEEGRRQPMAIVTAPENFQRLEQYKAISRRLARAEGLDDEQARALAAEGKTVVAVAGGLHADEVLGAQQLIELVYQLASRDDAETRRVLQDVIVLAVHANPDGHELVAKWYMRERDPLRRTLIGLPRLYQKYAGHDNNRDFYMATQAETININRVLYKEWFPQIVYDHHQTAPAGTVMFAPPFREPFNAVLDPLIPAGIESVGAAMHGRFAAEGKTGMTTRDGANYSVWWNGGLRTTAYFHNQIGLLTETIGSPTPTHTWRFRQSIDYSLTANRAVLDYAARNGDTLLFNMYRMGKNAIERGSRDSWTPRPHRPSGRVPDLRDPRGYILPGDQPDFPTVTKFVTALLRNGIAVHRATAPFSVGGTRYPAGSYVVRTAQAFRPHVLDMFEPQDHPDDIPQPGGAPRPPYDSAGWTLAFQMGVKFDRVLEAFDGPFEAIAGDAVRPPPGRVVWLPPSPLDLARGALSDSRRAGGRQEAAGFVLSHQPNDAFVAVNRLLKAGESVYWLSDRASRVMYVEGRASTLPILQKASDLGLTFTAVPDAPSGDAIKLRPVRIALADNTGGSVASGWMRWILERYEFPFDVVPPQAIDAGALRGFNVLILPDDVVPDRRAVPGLRRFVEEGGTLVAIGRATGIARQLDLPVSNPLVDAASRPLPSERYFVPGSVLRVRVDTTAPAAYGLEPDVDVFFDNSPVFQLGPDAASQGVRPIAWFPTSTPLRSGWAWGQAHLKDTVAAVEATMGEGRVLLFGPPVTFRAQSHGTFKFLFNSIYYGSAKPARLQ